MRRVPLPATSLLLCLALGAWEADNVRGPLERSALTHQSTDQRSQELTMPCRKQRRARSLGSLHRTESAPPKTRFSALLHAEVKLLLYTDPGRALDGFKTAQVGSLMQWPYYDDLKTRDPEQARRVCALAAERGIPERLEKPRCAKPSESR